MITCWSSSSNSEWHTATVLRNMKRVHFFRVLFFVVRQVLTSASKLEKAGNRYCTCSSSSLKPQSNGDASVCCTWKAELVGANTTAGSVCWALPQKEWGSGGSEEQNSCSRSGTGWEAWNTGKTEQSQSARHSVLQRWCVPRYPWQASSSVDSRFLPFSSLLLGATYLKVFRKLFFGEMGCDVSTMSQSVCMSDLTLCLG